MLCPRMWRGGAALTFVCAMLPVLAGAQPSQAAGGGTPPSRAVLGKPAVVGTLVAKPVSGETVLPTACRDRDLTPVNAAIQQQRGLVICTEEGKLVLLELSSTTTIHARFWGPVAISSLRDGDRIRAWGTRGDHGYVVNPTTAVQDVDVQEVGTDSQDFVSQSGQRVTLYVLSSARRSPVHGVVYAVPGGETKVYLCNGSLGAWTDLTAGKTVDITGSLFNRRANTYVDTDTVRIVSCR